MQALKETTKHEGFYKNLPNHTYLLSGDNAVAYIKEGTNTVIKITGRNSRGMMFDKRGRTFKTVDDSIFKGFLNKN